jgi:exonuclease SbcC
MAQELASLEGVEYSIEQFTKAKMDMLEARINGRFKLVRFKMFEDQINGGQVEACTTLISGVPFDNANNAARIQAGLDIINTLSDHYGVCAPVWVDNRESVIDLPETKSQLINLVVSESHKKLTVSPGKLVAMAV